MRGGSAVIQQTKNECPDIGQKISRFNIKTQSTNEAGGRCKQTRDAARAEI